MHTYDTPMKINIEHVTVLQRHKIPWQVCHNITEIKPFSSQVTVSASGIDKTRSFELIKKIFSTQSKKFLDNDRFRHPPCGETSHMILRCDFDMKKVSKESVNLPLNVRLNKWAF